MLLNDRGGAINRVRDGDRDREYRIGDSGGAINRVRDRDRDRDGDFDGDIDRSELLSESVLCLLCFNSLCLFKSFLVFCNLSHWLQMILGPNEDGFGSKSEI